MADIHVAALWPPFNHPFDLWASQFAETVYRNTDPDAAAEEFGPAPGPGPDGADLAVWTVAYAAAGYSRVMLPFLGLPEGASPSDLEVEFAQLVHPDHGPGRLTLGICASPFGLTTAVYVEFFKARADGRRPVRPSDQAEVGTANPHSISIHARGLRLNGFTIDEDEPREAARAAGVALGLLLHERFGLEPDA